MDPTNLVMRKACVATSMIDLREMARSVPMVSMNESMTRLAIGDAIEDVTKTSIRVYDMERYFTDVIISDSFSSKMHPNIRCASMGQIGVLYNKIINEVQKPLL
jgi:hypothetical protein